MNQDLLHKLGGDETQYPHALATQFPRIVERMISLWGTPELLVYLNGLLFDQRGDREGFPEAVAKDLFRLYGWVRNHQTEAMRHQAEAKLSHFDDVWETAEMQQGEKRSNGVTLTVETLVDAAQRGDIESIHKHLEAGLMVNAKLPDSNSTALLGAALYGHEHCIEALIRLGAAIEWPDAQGKRALHYAAASGSVDSVEVLLNAGASVDPVDNDGHTPLMLAVSAGKMRVVVRLLEAGASVNRQDAKERSPLHMAVNSKNARMIELLLSYDADKTLLDARGHTALELAMSSGDPKLAALF